jgi:hypothetical protein
MVLLLMTWRSFRAVMGMLRCAGLSCTRAQSLAESHFAAPPASGTTAAAICCALLVFLDRQLLAVWAGLLINTSYLTMGFQAR